MRSSLLRVFFWFCLCAVVLRLGIPLLNTVLTDTSGRDFASYYYGLKVTLAGQNPYDTHLLDAMASQEGTRTEVFPFFYPPPFLLLCLPFAALTLHQAFVTWYVFNCLTLLGVLWAIHRMLAPAVAGRPEAEVLPPLLALLAATFTPVLETLWIGQINLFVVLLLVLGLDRVLRGRDLSGGALLGAAAMIKMSPGLLLLWLLLKGRWKAVLAAAVCGVVLSVLALPVVGPSYQLYFYRTVLPGFSGSYHGLPVAIEAVGNHSVPSFFNRFFPGPDPLTLSIEAKLLSWVSQVGILVMLGRLFRGAWEGTGDVLGRALEASIIMALMVWFPVHAYEHHLVFLLLPLAALALAVCDGRLSARWLPWVGVTYGVLGFLLNDLMPVHAWRGALGLPGEVLSYMVREAKLGAIAVLMLAVGRARWTSFPAVRSRRVLGPLLERLSDHAALRPGSSVKSAARSPR